ncbi:uncharacterized protein [Primulina huaijiensis]|uniref:uncharacterized protein isoform X1 n=2 Tax=Primulina huaijiensis TaxID=1492673 RepID=UPI003CC763DC
MEKIPAACAMEWSIQLHKNLRSKEPGKNIEALEEIGTHLEWWNKESRPTVVAEYRLFGLIPGEEKLFLNSIFLRLADAFRLGNKQTKNEVVKLFLRLRRWRKRDGGEGILSKDKLENYLELLRRVKEVFDNGDAEERVSALLMFGCWANIAKDCADIRYIVLSSLVSGDVLEVKASLFAAGCLCELADDFGNVFLEMLTTMLKSPEIVRDVKLAGARKFCKMWCSFSLADKAYKTGCKLLMDSSEDDFSAIMLISLSRIAFSWKLLIPSQVELLTMFLSEDRSLHLRATSLRCHLFILARGVWNFSSSADMVQKLFKILNKSEFPVIQQRDAFKVLHKVFLLYSSTIPCMEIPEIFLKLLVVVKNMVQSSIVSIRVLAVSVLSDLSEKVLGRADIKSSRTGASLACKVISFTLDRILFLLTPMVEVEQHEFSSELEIKSFLNLLFILVEKHSYLCFPLLKEIHLFIGKLTSKLDNVVDTEETASTTHEPIKSNLMLYVSKILVACLKNIGDIDTEIYQVLEALKLQAEKLIHCSYFGIDTSMDYFLLLHLHAYYIDMTEKCMSSSKNSSPLHVDAVLQPDISTITWVKKILGSNSYWSAYKVGKVAACQGAWSTAAFIFEQLLQVVKSASYFCWLKSLARFSTSEKQMQSLFLLEQSTSSCPSEINFAERQGIGWKVKHNYMDILLGTHNMLLSSEELLETSDMGHLLSFQIWFLTTRAKFLGTVIDMMKLSDTTSCIRDDPPPSEQLERCILFPCDSTSRTFGSFMYTLTEVSYRMKKLAQELDFLILSSIGMDRQSVMIIEALALSCSLLAFTAGFVFLILKLHSSKKFQIYKSENSDQFHVLLVHDLVGRLRQKDAHTRRDLLYLLKSFGNYKGHNFLRFRTHVSVAGYESRVLHKLCEDSITGIVSLQKEASQVQQYGDGIVQIINDGCPMLLNVISKLFSISFRTPNHFFRVRPAASFELFVVDADGKSLDNISVLSGFHLSLSLCFQLKNLPSGLRGPIAKVCCILNCKLHYQISEIGDCKGKAHFSGQDQELDDMMGLNEKLYRYVFGPVESSRDQDDDRRMVTECVSFKLNEQGQGFASCLLDVSDFPVGSHRIKWLSGFIDGGGSYRCLLPLKTGMFFSVQDATSV